MTAFPKINRNRLTSGGAVHGCKVSELNRVRPGSLGQLDRDLIEGVQPYGEADQPAKLGGGRSPDHRLRVGQTGVLRGEDAQLSRHKDKVDAPFDEPGELVEPGFNVGTADRLDQVETRL